MQKREAMRIHMTSRRAFMKSVAAGGIALPFVSTPLRAANSTAITSAIPATGEALPVIGMGSSRTFDVGTDEGVRAQLTEVLRIFFDGGGALIDSSPMYGTAESVLGDLLQGVPNKENLFAATKVWINGKESGVQQMHESMARMRVERFDLMQIHNLRDWRTHLKTLEKWKAEGEIRYLGITTSHGRAHDELVRVLESETFDFVQFSYNIADRVAEKRLFPLARDKGIATLINRPYQRGQLFKKVKSKPLPEWAAEFDCASWGQYFLKFIVSHPDVTCVIPATAKPQHMADNMGAGLGRLPDASMRERMLEHFASL